MADIETKVRKQIEFYFSDSNFPRDKFMRQVAAGDKEGFIPIATIASFSRVKAISEDVALITKALKASEELKVSEDDQKVRRIKPLPTDDDTAQRTLYVKKVPTDVSIEEIETAFAPFGKVLSVRIRKGENHQPKGSVFVEFATTAEAIAAQNAKPQVRGETPAEFKIKGDYLNEKKNERKRKKTESKGDKTEKTETAPEEFNWTKGLIVQLKNVGPGVQRNEIREALSAFGKVAFVEHDTHEQPTFVRMTTAEDAQKTVESIESAELTLGGQTVAAALLEGEEEVKYWEKVKEFSQKKKSNFKKGGKRGGRGGKRGKF